MKFRHPDASFIVPDDCDPRQAWSRITHLGIGAHADDLEFMALHGILQCYEKDNVWFGGITCTDGAGSPQDNTSKGSIEELIKQRRSEQEEAARIGQYSVMTQLGYSSSEAKDPNDTRLTEDLSDAFRACRPETVYTHNPADKHDTHIAVLQRVVQAIRALPRDERPQRLLGCEVWRDLDWLNDEDKVVLDVSGNPGLAEKLAGVFKSQLAGGKRYDLAVRGRERANATFMESHLPDASPAVWFAMDLTPLLVSDSMSVIQLTNAHIARFKNEVMNKLGNHDD